MGVGRGPRIAAERCGACATVYAPRAWRRARRGLGQTAPAQELARPTPAAVARSARSALAPPPPTHARPIPNVDSVGIGQSDCPDERRRPGTAPDASEARCVEWWTANADGRPPALQRLPPLGPAPLSAHARRHEPRTAPRSPSNVAQRPHALSSASFTDLLSRILLPSLSTT